MTYGKKEAVIIATSLTAFFGLWLGLGWEPLIPAFVAAGAYGGLKLLIPTREETTELSLSNEPTWVSEEELRPSLKRLRVLYRRLVENASKVEKTTAKNKVLTICQRLDESLKRVERTRQISPDHKSTMEQLTSVFDRLLSNYISVTETGTRNQRTKNFEEEWLSQLLRGFTNLRDALSSNESLDMEAGAAEALALIDMSGLDAQNDFLEKN